ncbi:MAG: sugar transferase, partial [Actinobacteria bacterium]|nr:sugar transferase [Actinomycetota bacterium]
MAASAVGLAVAAPVFAAIAAAIRVESAGPVILRQTRFGRDGRDFDLFKFRTMVANPHTIGPGWLDAARDP